jgi:hypothetical protein
MIKKTYVASIADHGDVMLRAHLLDLAAPARGNAVPPKRGEGSPTRP